MSGIPDEAYDDEPDAGEETDEMSKTEMILRISNPESQVRFFLDTCAQRSPLDEIIRNSTEDSVRENLMQAAKKGEFSTDLPHFMPANKVKESGLSAADIVELVDTSEAFELVDPNRPILGEENYDVKLTDARVIRVMTHTRGKKVFIQLPAMQG